MTGYIVNNQGFIVERHVCQKNPMAHLEGEQEFLIPHDVVVLPLPKEAPPENKTFKFDSGAWTVVDDPAYLAKVQADKEAQDEAEKEKQRADKMAQEEQAAREKAQKEHDAKLPLIQSAKAKLISLGLDESEVNLILNLENK
jgi:hypothetical protein